MAKDIIIDPSDLKNTNGNIKKENSNTTNKNTQTQPTDIIIDPSQIKTTNDSNTNDNTNNENSQTTKNDIVVDPSTIQSDNTSKKENKWFLWEVWDALWGVWKWIKGVGSAIGNWVEDAIDEIWIGAEASWEAAKHIPLVGDAIWNAMQNFWKKVDNHFSSDARQQRELEDEYKKQQEKVKGNIEMGDYIGNVMKKYFPYLNKEKPFEVWSNALSALKW